MPYIASEVIEQARQIDLLTYLQACEPDELVRISPNNYCTRTHDSLKISNGKWMWWSHRIGGYNALDYLVKVKGISFVEAVETLMGRAAVMPSMVCTAPQKEQPKVLLLPERSPSADKVTEYLFGRGIDYGIIEYCISQGLVYESLPYHNAVFVGYDREHKPRYAAFRATNSTRIMGDCSGSDKHYSFRIADSRSDELHLFECAIDLLSFATLELMEGRDWRSENLVSLSGVYLSKKRPEESKTPMALSHYLGDNLHIRKVTLHFDNDAAGRSASVALRTKLGDQYVIADCPPQYGKDYNDFLCRRLGIFREKHSERREER